MSKKQKDVIDNIYPKGDRLKGREVDYLTRSATLICSAYAYYRCVLPHAAFRFVRIYETKNNPMFNTTHPQAKMHQNALQDMSKSIEEKKIKQFCFALCENSDPNNTAEALQFNFDYDAAAMDVLLPNATNVRVTTKWDFAVDLCEVLKRVRLIASYLSELPAGLKTFIMIQYLKMPQQLPKDFKYLNEYDLEKMETLPLARLPCDTHDMQMTVEIRSKYFVVSPNEIHEDVEKGLNEIDDDEGDSKDSTPPPPPPPKESDGAQGNDDDVKIVEDSLEEPRDDRMHLPDDASSLKSHSDSELASDPVENPMNKLTRFSPNKIVSFSFDTTDATKRSPYHIRENVERGLIKADDDNSDSKDSTPPLPPKESDDGTQINDDDVKMVEDSWEGPRDDRIHLPDYASLVKSHIDSELASDPVENLMNKPTRFSPNKTVSFSFDTTNGKKRSHSPANFEIKETRHEPEPKKLCQLTIHEYTPLVIFEALHENMKEKTEDLFFKNSIV